MTITSRVTLKSKFQTGDKPGGSDYANWIDSFLHLTDTSAQSVAGAVSFQATTNFQNISSLPTFLPY